ncbi:hypothetical protein DVR12_04775 [Chitinophaga silvatica]|uniref:WD40-like Beta Propeller Repeat n=1 Tax=Chitinophaga silvatica TaxID=2282649 RepID=A0A3E1YDA5_9BACT|nr:hypothetical protein [Chitinophaga silvatica]RFS24526.1 hypothetical protein DVR12_04775 [Chitinophaga silvatica]
MFNKLWLLLCATLIVFGCKNKSHDQSSVANDSTPPAIHSTPDDTVSIGNKTFLVYFIEKADFDKYPYPAMDTSEAAALAKDSTVKRDNGKLIIRLENGKERILTSNIHDEENFIDYSYIANYPSIKRKGFHLSYYEGSGFALVSTVNGDSMITWAAPAISPDKQYIITASMDLVAAFDPNGFELFSINNNDIKKIGEANLEKWGPGLVQWISNNTLISEYITVNDDGNTQVQYVKMVMQ